MHVTPENIDYFRDLAARLNGVGRGDRGPLIQDAMTFLGWSKSRVYNALKDVGWQSGRKPRSDRGGSKVSAETAQTVSSLMRQSCRDNGKMLLSAKDASAIAFYNNMIPRNDFTGATLFRAMRQHHVHPDHIRKAAPCVQMRSLHPNHVWEFDVSVCVLFYMKGGNKLKEMSGKDYYKNKPENFEKIAKERVLRYLACDHYTGAFYVQYFLSPGETSEVLFEFLMSAFTKRHDQDPFHGVPFKLIWDAGTANKAHMTKKFLESMQVECLTHQPVKRHEQLPPWRHEELPPLPSRGLMIGGYQSSGLQEAGTPFFT